MSGSSSTTSTSTSTSTARAHTGRSYDTYPLHTAHEVAPGIMDDGTLSATHPLVRQFLAHTTRKFALLETTARTRTRAAAIVAAQAATAKRRSKNNSKNKNKAKKMTAAEKEREAERERRREAAEVEAAVEHWHGQHKHPRVTRWRCMRGGGARVADVHDALGPGVTDRLAAAVFALAALSVYSFWADPAHWAFWALNVVEETAAVVHGVVRADPRVITVPKDVAWVDAETAVRVLRVWHGGFVPRQAPKKSPAASDVASDTAEGETSAKNANGKRTAADDGPATPTKRMRTKEPQNLAPTRQSARISMRKGAQVEPVDDDDDDESEEMAIDTDIVESAEPDAGSAPVDVEAEETAIAEPVATAELEVESESLAQEPQAVVSTKKSRSKPSRPRKSTGGRKPRAPRKPRASSGGGDVPSKPPVLAAPSPSSPSAPCIIRIPARSASSSSPPLPALRELLGEVLPSPPQHLSVPPAAGEATTGTSRESTAVGTPFSGSSTRVGTPLPDVEVKVEPKVVREIAAPVRASARLRTKILAGR